MKQLLISRNGSIRMESEECRDRRRVIRIASLPRLGVQALMHGEEIPDRVDVRYRDFHYRCSANGWDIYSEVG